MSAVRYHSEQGRGDVALQGGVDDVPASQAKTPTPRVNLHVVRRGMWSRDHLLRA